MSITAVLLLSLIACPHPSEGAPAEPPPPGTTHTPLPIPGTQPPDQRPLKPGEPIGLTRLAIAVTRADPPNGATLPLADWPRIPTTRLAFQPQVPTPVKTPIADPPTSERPEEPPARPRAVALYAVRSLSVTDSTGRDLVAPLLDDGRPEPLTRYFQVDSYAGTLQLAVDAPAPGATSIRVAFEIELSVCDRVVSLDVPAVPTWTPLRHTAFDGLDVSYICRAFSEDSSHLDLRPREAEWRVLRAGIPSPSGLMARLRPPQGFDSSGISFYIPEPYRAGAMLRLQLAEHQRTIIARFDDAAIPLP
ncbi:MAG: hypothetical protein DYG92_04015 [Leptolyngbya sp. PLA1]|nr:hypothetical protein [Leptolyngbya sp. PLA1]